MKTPASNDAVCKCGELRKRHILVLQCPNLRTGLFDPQWRCAKHTRYEGKGKPRVPCEWCWRLYISKHQIHDV